MRWNYSTGQWVLVSIDSFRININRYDPFRAGSFIELPKVLASKKAIVNIENYDNQWDDLLYCPENIIDDNQLPKLFTTLYDKKKYRAVASR